MEQYKSTRKRHIMSLAYYRLIKQDKQEQILELFKDRLPKHWESEAEDKFTYGELLKLVG